MADDSKFDKLRERFTEIERGGEEAVQTAIQLGGSYGKLALQSAFLLNGGGLLAIPSLFAATLIYLQGIHDTAALFVGGLVLAGLSCFLSYINFTIAPTRIRANYRVKMLAEKIEAVYGHEELTLDDLEVAEGIREDTKGIADRGNRWVAALNATMALACASGIGSYVCVVLGFQFLLYAASIG